MKLQIFALKNVKVGYWNPPTFSNSDKESVKASLYRYCQMNTVDARKAHYDECELYWCGEFDDIRGDIIPSEKEFLIDLKGAFANE